MLKCSRKLFILLAPLQSCCRSRVFIATCQRFQPFNLTTCLKATGIEHGLFDYYIYFVNSRHFWGLFLSTPWKKSQRACCDCEHTVQLIGIIVRAPFKLLLLCTNLCTDSVVPHTHTGKQYFKSRKGQCTPAQSPRALTSLLEVAVAQLPTTMFNHSFTS